MRADWTTLPREEKYLYNPAFLALLIIRTTGGHQSQMNAPIPIPLLFLALSISLNRPFRRILPKSVATNLVRWTQDHPEVRVLTPLRTVSAMDLYREGLLYALATKACSVEGAAITLRSKKPLPAPQGRTDEVIQCQRAAFFMGRWMARSGSPGTVLALFGLRP